ncbi:MAG: glucosidase [Burkholderiales bacterium]|nr:glucosidase [Phycisphaerae bacterium]
MFEATLLPEQLRLQESAERTHNWQRWGPYLSERQWGTVREDYSADGDCWSSFPHDHARARAYRWGEDGLLGITDRECRMCFALAMWNGRDPILKERLFGLTNLQGNHGEDVKEHYYYLESSPTHAWMRGLYKYPFAEFPYEKLILGNQRAKNESEYELSDTGVFEQSRYFDVQADYAKAGPNDLCIRITIFNRSAEPATLHLLPQLWFRNSWSWGGPEEAAAVPSLRQVGTGTIEASHESLGQFYFHAANVQGKAPALLFTDNDTNAPRLYGKPPEPGHFYKDGFHDYVIDGAQSAINPANAGTKAAAHYVLTIPAESSASVDLRLFSEAERPAEVFGESFEKVMISRREEATQYVTEVIGTQSPEVREVASQAYAGLLWSKQHYHYVVREWLDGDPKQPPPPTERDDKARNREWKWHLFNRDVISMPDKWEYPWYAAWDLAFHMIPMARIDPQFAKDQLLLLLREWYMHPSGQLPAYEFNFSDVNPPVHAWACWRVYKITGVKGQRDRAFLARAFQKLMLNFTWWVNRKDASGKNLFGGGFLGLDNIGIFDRSQPLPTGGRLEQADGTAWMAFFCGTMLSMALELAAEDPVYEDVASKFFEHFIAIVDAMHRLGGTGLWDDEDGFYYDQIFLKGQAKKLKVRSMVGIIPLFAAEVLDGETVEKLGGFKKRMDWFLKYRPDLTHYINMMCKSLTGQQYMLAIPSKDRLTRMLKYILDENEFLSPFGVRSLSRKYAKPYTFSDDGKSWSIGYEPGDSASGLFGGNSNWRGPVWFPVNFLLIESLEKYHHFYGDELKVECPTGSGNMMTLQQAAAAIRNRLVSLFLPDAAGRRPCHGTESQYATDPHWRNLVLFHEFFHGETGKGLGANHQTGWTALVAEMLR